jgi:hypothetical protein
MGYFGNLNNGLLKNFEQNLQNRKRIYRYVLLLIDW